MVFPKMKRNEPSNLTRIGTKSITSPSSSFNLVIDGMVIEPSPTPCNLGVIFDSALSYEKSQALKLPVSDGPHRRNIARLLPVFMLYCSC